MLTGQYPSTPKIIRLKAASGRFRWTILIVIFTTLAFNSVLKALLKSSSSNTGCSTHDGFVNIIVYLNDFLVIGATQAECIHA